MNQLNKATALTGCTLFSLLTSVACSSKTDVQTTSDERTTRDENDRNDGGASHAGDAKALPEGDSDSLFAISNTITSAETPNTYLSFVPSLDDATSSVDSATGLEFSGRAKAYGWRGGDAVYVSSFGEPTFTEVTFSNTQSPALERTVSFANLGVSQTYSGISTIVSPTKAYYIDPGTLEVVVWNPSDMSVVSTFSTGFSVAEDRSLVFLADVLKVGDKVLLVASEFDVDGLAQNGVHIAVIDTATDTVVSNTKDTRAAALLVASPTADGDIYLSSNWLAAASHYLYPELAAAPRLLRIKAGETALDPEWSRSLSDELGTVLWMGAVPSPTGGLYFQAIEEDNDAVLAAKSDDDVWAVRNARPWSWYSAGDGDAALEPVADPLLDFPVSAVPIRVGETNYFIQYDGTASTLSTLSREHRLTPGLNVKGLVTNLVWVK